MTRYVITELEGHFGLQNGGDTPYGLSVHVIDTMSNRRLMATFRSEDYAKGCLRSVARERARAAAAAVAAALEAA